MADHSEWVTLISGCDAAYLDLLANLLARSGFEVARVIHGADGQAAASGDRPLAQALRVARADAAEAQALLDDLLRDVEEIDDALDDDPFWVPSDPVEDPNRAPSADLCSDVPGAPSVRPPATPHGGFGDEVAPFAPVLRGRIAPTIQTSAGPADAAASSSDGPPPFDVEEGQVPCPADFARSGVYVSAELPRRSSQNPSGSASEAALQNNFSDGLPSDATCSDVLRPDSLLPAEGSELPPHELASQDAPDLEPI